MSAMTFDALPYDIFRRVASSLDRSDISTLSATDMKRAVLAFCLWERTAVSKGGGLKEGTAAARYAQDADSGSPLGAPIYRFLSPCDASKESGKCRSDTVGGAGACDAKTVLASYPRSGNSLLRRLLEEVTGTITGSDTRPDRTLSRSLSVFGMQGEGVVDHRVQVVKTHYPERTGLRPFEGDKAILLVRNPFDAVDSYFNMALTNTHDQSLHDSVYEEFQEFWDGMIRNEFKVWERFHLHWLSSTVPVHVVRYEDLLARPEGALTDLVAFIHDISPAEISKSFGDRIRNAPAVVNAGRSKSNKQARPKSGAGATAGVTAGAGAAASATKAGESGGGGSGGGGEADGVADTRSTGTGLYAPRTSGRGVGGSLRKRFSDDQVAWCVRETGTLLRRFGYDPSSQGFPPVVDADLLELARLQSLYTTAGARDGRGGWTASTAGAASAASAERAEGTASAASTESTDRGVENSNVTCALSGDGEVVVPVQHQTPKTPVENRCTVTVNDTRSDAAAAATASGARWGGIRGERDAYGRAMTPFRKSHTQRDTRPLPLKGEDAKAEAWRRRRRAERETNGGRDSISGGGGGSSTRNRNRKRTSASSTSTSNPRVHAV